MIFAYSQKIHVHVAYLVEYLKMTGSQCLEPSLPLPFLKTTLRISKLMHGQVNRKFKFLSDSFPWNYAFQSMK